jgi:hypothetical protein
MMEVPWDNVLSVSFGFLVGAFVGMTGKYGADLFTDRRREKEAKQREKKDFLDVVEKCPDLIGDLKADLIENPHVREFAIIDKDGTLVRYPGMVRFAYGSTDENSYSNKIQILENLHLVEGVTSVKTPMYRMTEEFVGLVMKLAQAKEESNDS